MNDNDFGRAILFLETLGDVPAAKAMWHNLANVALKQQIILVNCFLYIVLHHLETAILMLLNRSFTLGGSTLLCCIGKCIEGILFE